MNSKHVYILSYPGQNISRIWLSHCWTRVEVDAGALHRRTVCVGNTGLLPRQGMIELDLMGRFTNT